MADTLQLQVATPEKLLVDEQVSSVQVPAANGFLGILPGHAALLSELGAGALSYEGGGGPHLLAVAGGFVEVFDNHVRVLADRAESRDSISVDEARRDVEEGSKALAASDSQEGTDAAFLQQQRGQAFLDVAEQR